MFEILNGRDHFFQWDTNQKLIVEDDSILEVHFCNGTANCSLVCRVYDENGLRIADVPNSLLQDNMRIKVYGYTDTYTKIEKCFEVNKRSKPDDYVYTETEIKRYEDLEKRVEELEKNGGGGSAEITPEDMEKIKADVIAEVEDEVKRIAITEAGNLVNGELELAKEEIRYTVPYKADLVNGKLSFKSNVNGRDYELFTADLPPYVAVTNTSQLTNDSGFITDAAIPGIAEQAAALVDTNLLSAIGGGVLQ